MAFSDEDLGRVAKAKAPATDNPILARIERILREAVGKKPEPVTRWKFTVKRNAAGKIIEVIADAG